MMNRVPKYLVLSLLFAFSDLPIWARQAASEAQQTTSVQAANPSFTLTADGVPSCPGELQSLIVPEGVYLVGGEVLPPQPQKTPEATFSDEARKYAQSVMKTQHINSFEAKSLLAFTVDTNGVPQDVCIENELGHGFDRRAFDAVSKYRFKPATLNGKPVPVRLSVVITFGLGENQAASVAQQTTSVQAASVLPTPDSLVAEGVIGRDGVYLPVLIHGHAGTVLLDLGADEGWMFATGLQELGVPATEPLDSLTLGPVVVRNLPVRQGWRGQAPRGMAPVVGLLGANVLSHFDLLFDGPAQRMVVYAASMHPSPAGAASAPATGSTSPAAGWLPSGFQASDCVPMGFDRNYPERVFFPFAVNGHAVHGMFDSGSRTTNINLPAAHLIGITKRTPGVQLLPPGVAPQFAAFNGQRVWQVSAGLTLTSDTHTFSPSPVLIYQHLPREKGPTDAELSVGLDAIRNQLFFVSYSTRRVCLSAPFATFPATVPFEADTATSGDAKSLEPSSGQVLLTADALTRMTTFWTSFFKEPPAIRDTARSQYQMPLLLHLDLGAAGIRDVTLRVVDMKAMAAKFPSVAADFEHAALTPEQWTQLRKALYTAVLSLSQQSLPTQDDVSSSGGRTSGSASVVAQNIAFLQTHQTGVYALQQAGMWFPSLIVPVQVDMGGDLDP